MNKPNHPDEICLGRPGYSIWADWKVNGWLFVATIISAACDIMFPSIVRQWPVALQIVAAVAPFVAILLWIRNLTQWVSGMDELHRRITLQAILVAIGAVFFVVMIWHRLERAGAFYAVSPIAANSAARWDIATVGHVFLLMTVFYFLGARVLGRRFA